MHSGTHRGSTGALKHCQLYCTLHWTSDLISKGHWQQHDRCTSDICHWPDCKVISCMHTHSLSPEMFHWTWRQLTVRQIHQLTWCVEWKSWFIMQMVDGATLATPNWWHHTGHNHTTNDLRLFLLAPSHCVTVVIKIKCGFHICIIFKTTQKLISWIGGHIVHNQTLLQVQPKRIFSKTALGNLFLLAGINANLHCMN